MADKDFAKMQVDGGTERRRTGVVIMMVLILLVVAGSFGGGFWMGMGFSNQESSDSAKGDSGRMQAKLEILEAELRRYEAEAKEREKALEEARTSVGELTFYKELPEQEVTPEPLSPGSKKDAPAPSSTKTKDDVASIIRDEMAAQPKPEAKPKTSGNLMVQVGSYQKRTDAEDLKQQLARLRLTAMIEETVVPELGMWYRVYLGPYKTRAEAEFDKATVQKSMHITGLITSQSQKQ